MPLDRSEVWLGATRTRTLRREGMRRGTQERSGAGREEEVSGQGPRDQQLASQGQATGSQPRPPPNCASETLYTIPLTHPPAAGYHNPYYLSRTVFSLYWYESHLCNELNVDERKYIEESESSLTIGLRMCVGERIGVLGSIVPQGNTSSATIFSCSGSSGIPVV
ncbi:hypothetical protein J6590_028859 [Homalodisca vitripennis]|nr:hypothetical protein J6590_028859 [Homalodisca vitripennis]